MTYPAPPDYHYDMYNVKQIVDQQNILQSTCLLIIVLVFASFPKLQNKIISFQLFFMHTALYVLNYDSSLKSVAGLLEHLSALCILKGFLAATWANQDMLGE